MWPLGCVSCTVYTGETRTHAAWRNHGTPTVDSAVHEGLWKDSHPRSTLWQVDAKTLRKWVWEFIEALADLEPYVVGALCLH
jgi:hypothetical protein